MYNQPLCCVTNNGHASESFQISRGIRQGCPLSALLFLLVAETMANHIRNQQSIKGLTVNGCTVKITQMADDTTVFLKDVQSVKGVLDTLEHFSCCAGLKLNKEKTEAIQLGKVTCFIKNKFAIKWVKGPIKVIGIWVGKDKEVLYDKNITAKIEKLKKLLNMWQSRNLTIKGKITILKTLAMPQLLYPFTSLHVNQKDIDAVDKLFYEFIWPKGKHHVKKTTLVQNVSNGGLNMPDFNSMFKAMKLTWINRLITKNNTFTNLVRAITRINDPKSFLTRKPLDTKFYEDLPLFYEQLMQIWLNIYANEPHKIVQLLSEPLWFNKYICIDNNTVHFKNWSKAGINKIIDLVNEDGKLLNLTELVGKYHLKTNFMEYNMIMAAIPKKWIKQLKGVNTKNILIMILKIISS